MSDNLEDKKEIEVQFEQLIKFLETQLEGINGEGESSYSNVQTPTLSIDSNININEVRQKIGQNGKYLEILQAQWK